MYYNWNDEKNEILKKDRGISFEEVVWSIEHDQLLDVVDNTKTETYKNQRIFIVKMKNYVWLVPFVENEEEIFFKTIIPSRKAKKKYMNGGKKND